MGRIRTYAFCQKNILAKYRIRPLMLPCKKKIG
jgi:hypothetical protein